jgi:hypothetical protein
MRKIRRSAFLQDPIQKNFGGGWCFFVHVFMVTFFTSRYIFLLKNGRRKKIKKCISRITRVQRTNRFLSMVIQTKDIRSRSESP